MTTAKYIRTKRSCCQKGHVATSNEILELKKLTRPTEMKLRDGDLLPVVKGLKSVRSLAMRPAEPHASSDIVGVNNAFGFASLLRIFVVRYNCIPDDGKLN